MTEAKHTPTLEMHPLPWSLDAEEACILDATGDAVQHFEEADERECEYHALIVSAVNAYPLLNEAVEVLREVTVHQVGDQSFITVAHPGRGHWSADIEANGRDIFEAWFSKVSALLSKLDGTMTEPTEDESATIK